jgi:hypothetical protein
MAGRRDRDVYVAKSPAQGVPAVVFDDVTGRYEGADLASMRARRPTPERISRLEKKQDDDRSELKALAMTVADLRVDVAGIDGKLDVLPRLLSLIEGANTAEHETKRLGMATRTKIILAIVGVISAAVGVAGSVLAGGA